MLIGGDLLVYESQGRCLVLRRSGERLDTHIGRKLNAGQLLAGAGPDITGDLLVPVGIELTDLTPCGDVCAVAEDLTALAHTHIAVVEAVEVTTAAVPDGLQALPAVHGTSECRGIGGYPDACPAHLVDEHITSVTVIVIKDDTLTADLVGTGVERDADITAILLLLTHALHDIIAPDDRLGNKTGIIGPDLTASVSQHLRGHLVGDICNNGSEVIVIHDDGIVNEIADHRLIAVKSHILVIEVRLQDHLDHSRLFIGEDADAVHITGVSDLEGHNLVLTGDILCRGSQ